LGAGDDQRNQETGAGETPNQEDGGRDEVESGP